MTALLLFLTALLIALQRVLRRGRVRARALAARAPGGAARTRAPAAPSSPRAGRRHRRLHLGRPGRHHDDLDRHRRARRARRWPTCSSRSSAGRSATASRSRSRSTVAYLLITSAHIVAGELVPKLYVDRQGRGRRAARGAAAALLPAALHAVHRRPDRDQRPDPARARRRPRRDREEGGTPEELKALIAESYTGGKLDPGEAGMLARRLPPARAGGPPGDDADPRRGHRRHLRGRRDRAAALHLLGPHAPARHRGREPGPRPRHRALQLAGAASS